MSSTNNSTKPAYSLETDVLVVGGGPVGLFTAYRLGKLNVNAILVERNLSTSKYPKMDITNERTMELYKKAGLDSLMRSHGVPASHGFNEIYATGLGQDNYRIAQIVSANFSLLLGLSEKG
jgi:FAD-dependent monooxygenase